MKRWLPFLLIFLLTAALRVIALPQVPPGLQHDEVFHGHDAVTVLLGYRPLYFTSNAGNEPLFIYLMSFTIGLFGHNAWGIRLAAVICGLLALLFTYLWIRRAYNNRTALIASALVTVSFWPLFLSRVGLRAASVPMLAALTAWLMFEALHRQQRRWFVLTGVALGLSLYTYPAARTLPVSFLLFWLIYSTLSRTVTQPHPPAPSPEIKKADFRRGGATGAPLLSTAVVDRRGAGGEAGQLHKSLLITLLTALIVFAPLGYVIATQPQADVRLQQLDGPVQEALQGNLEPVLRYTVATLGMFNVAGDPIARYNLPGRPVFDFITGLLFLGGVLIALRQWREPRNLFVLLWLPIGLLPSMLSDSAPSFLRASAALPVAFLFPALAIEWLLTLAAHPAWRATSAEPRTWRERRAAKSKGARRFIYPVGCTLVIGLIVFTGVLTVRDYFFVWPTRSDVREVYRSDLAAAANWIAQQPGDQPIVVASTNPRDLDPFLFDFQLAGTHEVKWIDRAFAVVFPAQPAKLISPAYAPIDPQLRDRFLPPPSSVSKFEDGSIAFEVFDLAPHQAFTPTITMVLSDRSGELNAPIDLNHSLEFLGYETSTEANPGAVVPLTLHWRVKQDVQAQQLPLSLFVHLLDERGEFAAGRDLLAFPTAGWRSGDVWLQQNDVPLPSDLKPGTYRLEIGVYSQADGSRWRVYDEQGNDAGDRLLLSEIEVKP